MKPFYSLFDVQHLSCSISFLFTQASLVRISGKDFQYNGLANCIHEIQIRTIRNRIRTIGSQIRGHGLAKITIINQFRAIGIKICTLRNPVRAHGNQFRAIAKCLRVAALSRFTLL